MQVLDRVTSSYAEPILDAPCGFGRNALALASHGYDVIAVANNSVALPQISQRIGGITIERIRKDHHTQC